MNTIPTAEEFYKEQFGDSYKDYMIVSTMIQFAKFHVQAALEAAYNNYELENSGNGYDPDDHSQSVIKSSIINAYPLTNIK